MQMVNLLQRFARITKNFEAVRVDIKSLLSLFSSSALFKDYDQIAAVNFDRLMLERNVLRPQF